MKKPYVMTVADFKRLICEEISGMPDDGKISFGNGDLSFYRPKLRGDILNIEFNEVYTVAGAPLSD